MILDGFWLPAALRNHVLTDVDWEVTWLRGGLLLEGPADGAVGVRWPRLTSGRWDTLLAGLQRGRHVPADRVAERWESALRTASATLLTNAGQFLPVLGAATGYSEAMLAIALQQRGLLEISALRQAASYRPTWSVATRWERMADLPGLVRFFPARPIMRGLAALRPDAPLCRPAPPTDLVLGYAAGNVPGTALLIMLLGMLANQPAGPDLFAPAVLVRNSRHEPLFVPQVLTAIEAFDPELVASSAVLIWDYSDQALQAGLMRRAGLMVAAASDEVIAALAAQQTRYAAQCRFHAHGHKASFSVIEGPTPELAELAALDSSLWDQNGCLSARVHFVTSDVETYSRQLSAAMRLLATRVPRGTTPRRLVHRAFDSYTAAAAPGTDQVQICSSYDDDFAVIVDRRTWDREMFRRAVNACQGRVVVIRPTRDVFEAARTLRWLPPENLQSLSVALDQADLMALADAAGAAGITAIRQLGRAAFPSLAYSWDGLLPIDMAYLRGAGHFTTIEFDQLLHGS